MKYEFRPLDWTGPSAPRLQRARSRFKAGYEETLNLLFSEAENLGARHLILQVDLAARDIRADGLPRSSARYGNHPGVIVSFDSRHGPLRYATDEFDAWKANLRAIALSLKALRDVDRYGVSKRGEQYTGWSALPAGTSGTLRIFDSAEDALRWMRKSAGNGAGEGLAPAALYKLLARTMHPDTGGNAELWERLDAARQLLIAAGML